MSGGSFDYLYCADLLNRTEQLTSMFEEIKELTGNDHNTKTFRDMKSVIDAVETIQKLQDKMSDVWFNIEWWRSGDRSKMDAIKAILKYEENMA